MAKYFIDGGAHRGESVRLFRSQYPDAVDYRIISFEPNPMLADAFTAPEFADVEFHNEAIWIADGTVDFFHVVVTDLAASCHPENRYIADRVAHVQVPCIDLSRWMRERFTPDDTVILKLDIEGSEYEVLEKMLADGTFQSLVDQLFIEYHYTQRTSITVERHNALLAQVEACGMKNVFWHAARVGASIMEEIYVPAL